MGYVLRRERLTIAMHVAGETLAVSERPPRRADRRSERDGCEHGLTAMSVSRAGADAADAAPTARADGAASPPSPPLHGEWGETDSLLAATPAGAASDALDGGGAALPAPPGKAAAARRARAALYMSHGLSAAGQRAWEFLVGLVLLRLHGGESLLLVGAWGVADSLGQALAGPALGAFVARTERLRAAQRMYFFQNVGATVSASALLLLLTGGAAASGTAYWPLVALAVAAGAASSAGAAGAGVSVEREWTRALAAGDAAALAEMNAAMKRIDLLCLIGAPIGAGALLARSPGAAVAATAAWSLAAWAPECWLLRRAQAAAAALQAPPEPPPPPDAAAPRGWHAAAAAQAEALRLYARQPAAPAGAALALLYLTVMSFGPLMTAFLNWRGLGAAALAEYRGAGAAAGVAATFAFPRAARAAGLPATGAAALWAQAGCLLAALALQRSAHALAWGLALSRFGLWGFDLAANQLLQETAAPPGALGAVMGVQGSLQQLAQLAAAVAGAAAPDPARFPALMAASVGAVLAAAALFSAFAARARREGLAPRDVELPPPLSP
jgi:iron-regulated transporter 1